MMEQSKNTKCGTNCDHIKGINCSVKDCTYHDGECYCTANSIAVAPTGHDHSSCATYKPCDNKSCR